MATIRTTSRMIMICRMFFRSSPPVLPAPLPPLSGPGAVITGFAPAPLPLPALSVPAPAVPLMVSACAALPGPAPVCGPLLPAAFGAAALPAFWLRPALPLLCSALPSSAGRPLAALPIPAAPAAWKPRPESALTGPRTRLPCCCTGPEYSCGRCP